MSSHIIPKERLTAWQRWELASLDEHAAEVQAHHHEPEPEPEAHPPPEEVQIPPVPYPTAEELERVHQEAWQEGFDSGRREGHEAGYREGRERAQSEADALCKLVAASEAAISSMDEQLAEVMVRLCGRIASEVIRQTIKVKPEVVVAVVEELLADVPEGAGRIRLALHPEDLQLVENYLAGSGGEHKPALSSDPTLSRGGARLDTDLSSVDAGLQERWRRVAEALSLDPGWV